MSTRIPAGIYVTVEQYRKRMGLADSRSIYRALSLGNVCGAVKVGRTWIIPVNAVIVDKRIKHGLYVGLAGRVKQINKIY